MKDNKVDEQDIVQRSCNALDDSVLHLDGPTLSRLTQARNLALAPRTPALRWNSWLPLGAAGSAALVAALMVPVGPQLAQQQPASDLTLPLLAMDDGMAALEDPELLEDLDMMLWLVEVENHAS